MTHGNPSTTAAHRAGWIAGRDAAAELVADCVCPDCDGKGGFVKDCPECLGLGTLHPIYDIEGQVRALQPPGDAP